MKIFKNPIILGILFAAIAYLFLYWQEDRKKKENKEYEKKPINILIPGIIGILVWFLSSYYFEKNNIPNSCNDTQPIYSAEKPNLISQPTYKLVRSEESIGSRSYHLVGKNKVRLPPTDVFIDVAKF